MTELQQIIEKAWDNRELLTDKSTIEAIRSVISLLDDVYYVLLNQKEMDGKLMNGLRKLLYYIFQFKK